MNSIDLAWYNIWKGAKCLAEEKENFLLCHRFLEKCLRWANQVIDFLHIVGFVDKYYRRETNHLHLWNIVGSSSSNKRDNSSSDRSGASNYSKKSKSSSSSNVSGDRGQSHSSRALERGSASSGSVGVSNIGRDGSSIGDRSGGIAGVITEHGGGRHHHDKVKDKL